MIINQLFNKTVLILGLGLLYMMVSCDNNSGRKLNRPSVSEESINTDTLKAAIIDENPELLPSKHAKKYKLRKYKNVKVFYERIAKPAVDLCLDNNVPPAAILAIAGLESGWNEGYIGRITGNILSLGNRRNDKELPALRVPKLKSSGKIIFDSLEIIKYKPSELEWENRPPSLKKDYRPEPWGGTPYNLAYFKYHPKEKAKAQAKNIEDFVTIFISRNSRIAVYRNARHMMDSLVNEHGKQVLLEQKTAVLFINQIGGRPNSFNFRESWPKKVTYIIKNAGLAELTQQMYQTNKDFKELW
ncbi:MAG: hypothetical protein C0598_14485 [Marinilabiliales bacterium]|nr:MAG: hypothetical protein C0598_14485 [Marinilabiliales bacterium]